MEKCCEFCRALRPVVYCKADAAHLCLSCDAKIHSANTVFNRHQRTVLCESCQGRPAYVQCLDHRMFMCNACDRSQHTSSSQHHHKRTIRSYTDCPSAKDFAALWGFQSNEIDNKTLSTSCGSCDSSVVSYDIHGQSCSQIECLSGGARFEMGSTSKQYEIYCKGEEHKKTGFILHQILDLERLQLAKGNSPSAQSDLSSSAHHTWNSFHENLDWHLQHCETTGTNFQLNESLLQDPKDDPLPFLFSEAEHLPSNSTIGLPLQTESIWQCRSPVQSSQLWSQNMQDLGVCEELVCHDDFNIPDVDLTFRNFEELFGGDQDPTRLLLDDKDVSYSSMERDMSLDKSDDCNSRAMVDVSEASSMYLTQPADFDKDTSACNKVVDVSGSMDSNSPHAIRPPLSTLPFSESRIFTVSNNADCHDTQPLSTSPDDVDAGQLEVRASSRMRYKEKKHSRLTEKKLPYLSRKATTNIHKLGKGRIVKTEEEYDSDTIDVTRSY
ncbi:putative zinc finger protein At1g68190 [Rosa rugosa]|uniref:putative zinc finger protein At1g68190 n=1 Tax=Rosa rugosa TaxID=74645 RepID=UPI002B403D88|nr:putative zinc finger protein At1g68190 [Rosa rugosa]XP_061994056.1 putative zinc finger protein At1g68190 [Rosa rugosa]